MGRISSQITSLTIVYSTVYSGADQGKYQSSASLAFVWGIHRGPVNYPHKWPVTRKMFLFDDVIMPTIVLSNRHRNLDTVPYFPSRLFITDPRPDIGLTHPLNLHIVCASAKLDWIIIIVENAWRIGRIMNCFCLHYFSIYNTIPWVKKRHTGYNIYM